MRLGPRGRQRTLSSASREGEDPASMPAEGGGTRRVSGGPSRGQWSLKPPDSAPAVALTKDHELGGFKHNAYSPSLPDPEVQGHSVCRAGCSGGWRGSRESVQAPFLVSGGSGRAWHSLTWRRAAPGLRLHGHKTVFPMHVCLRLSSVRTPPALHTRMISSLEP